MKRSINAVLILVVVTIAASLTIINATEGSRMGQGATNRLVTCATPVVRSQVRYFDRGGVASGVSAEVISWKALISE